MPSPTIEITGVAEIIAALQSLPDRVGSKMLRSTAIAACQPALVALKANTPEGPTGNLLRAAAIKGVEYKSTGTVVVIVGYIRSGTGKTGKTGGSVRIGPDRAYHQYWIEDGTAERQLSKSMLASNLKTMGGYGAAYFRARGFDKSAFVAERGPGGTTTVRQIGVVAFVPKNGVIAAVEPQRPMARAYAETRETVQINMENMLLDALNKATGELRGS
jgi:hypothetical protein